jgi:hypothetical protein
MGWTGRRNQVNTDTIVGVAPLSRRLTLPSKHVLRSTVLKPILPDLSTIG